MKKEVKNIENKVTDKDTALDKKRKFTNANYTMAMTVLVAAILIIVNLLVSSLDEGVRTIDLTQGDIFTLTEETESVLEDIDQDVVIYMILEDITQRNDDLYKLLKVYDDASDHIRMEVINPASNPTFLENREYVSDGSIIVESDNRFRGVELKNMYITNTDASTNLTSIFYDMEGQITSAIDYVTREDIPKAYFLKNSNGTRDTFGSDLQKYIIKQNIELGSVNLDDEGQVPEDADILILDQPVDDISKTEYDLICNFMDKGGSLLMFEYYNVPEENDTTNIDNLMAKYGISVDYGAAIEANSSYMYDSKSYYGKPIIKNHAITEDLINDDTNLIVVMGDAINILDVADNITAEPLLTSTSKAYYKDRAYKDSSNSTSMQQLASDPVGTYNYAVAVTDEVSSDVQSKLVYISSMAFAEADMYEESYGSGNSEFVVKCMQWLADQDKTVSIPLKSKTYSNLVYTVKAKRVVMYVFVFGIPAAVLAYGGYVWYKRRKR